MDYSISKTNISNIVCSNETNIPQNIDSDIALPEYVDDIETVLSCALTGEIESVSPVDGRVSVEGHGLIKLLYISKDGAVHCFESAVPFSRFADIPGFTPQDCLSVSVKTQYVNCRLVNPRRFDAHGSIVISLRTSRLSECEAVSAAEGAGLQLKTEKLAVSNAYCVNEKPFTLSEMLEIGQELPSIAQIISVSASPFVGETKLISQKALVKGDMTVGIIYISDEKQSRICSAQFTLPISQIVETDKSDESCRCLTRVEVLGTAYSVKADSDGEIRLADISVSARVKVSVFKDEEISLVTDAYSTEYEIECERKKLEARRLREQFTDTCLCRSSFSSQGREIKDILSLTARDVTSCVSHRDTTLTVSGTAKVGMIIEYADGEKGYAEKQLEYEYRREAADGSIICESTVRANTSGFLLTSPSNADIRVEIEIDAAVFEIRSISPVTGITVNDGCRKSPCRAAVTLYYPDRDESVWEIARKYNTTVSAVVEENQLENGKIQAGKMLLIPRM